MKTFVLIHGLPGCGKTTLCRRLAERYSGFHYVDLGKSPKFREQPMVEICIDDYLANGGGRDLVTEGYLPTIAARDRMARKVLARCGLDRAIIVGLDERDMDILAGRRNRSAADYALMRAEIEFGSRKHAYVHYTSAPGEGEAVDERLDRLMEMIEAARAAPPGP